MLSLWFFRPPSPTDDPAVSSWLVNYKCLTLTVTLTPSFRNPAVQHQLMSPAYDKTRNPNPNPNPNESRRPSLHSASLSACCTAFLPATAQMQLLCLLLPQPSCTHSTPSCPLVTTKHLTPTLCLTLTALLYPTRSYPGFSARSNGLSRLLQQSDTHMPDGAGTHEANW